LTFNGVQGIISQKIELFITTAVKPQILIHLFNFNILQYYTPKLELFGALTYFGEWRKISCASRNQMTGCVWPACDVVDSPAVINPANEVRDKKSTVSRSTDCPIPGFKMKKCHEKEFPSSY
jgi:hypothetical protein